MEEMPREKLLKIGVEGLREDELLAIILQVGSKDEDVFTMSKRLIDTYGLKRLCHMKYEELCQIPGIKAAKACKLLVIFEMVRRMLKEEDKNPRISTSKELFDYVYPAYMLERKEVITVIYTDSKCRVLHKEEFHEDLYHEVRIPIKAILLHALDVEAYGLFLVHNHPGGHIYPSDSDVEATQSLEMALKAVDILLLDHIIIAEDTYYSFADNLDKIKEFRF